MRVPTRPLPALGRTRPLRLPEVAERRLSSGLTVIAVHRASVPLAEVRLRIPFFGVNRARAAILTQTLLSGNPNTSGREIALQLQSVGGWLTTNVSADCLTVSGVVLADGVERLLTVLASCLACASYPTREVTVHRARYADRMRAARVQPTYLVHEAMLRRLYGGHPYARELPTRDQVTRVRPANVRALHAERVRPAGATLVIVGGVEPEGALDVAEHALSVWSGPAGDFSPAPVPPRRTGPLTLVGRPRAVQSSLRLALPAVPYRHPDHAAVELANFVYGGYLASRLVRNLREDKGYVYNPHSDVEHVAADSRLVICADTATETTAAVLRETVDELSRLADDPPSHDELADARQYALAMLWRTLSSQKRLAGHVAHYAAFGLSLDHLLEYAANLEAVARDDVVAAARAYLTPAAAVAVVLGDADRIEPSLAELTSVVRVQNNPV